MGWIKAISRDILIMGQTFFSTYWGQEVSVLFDNSIATTDWHNYDKSSCANHKSNDNKEPRTSQKHIVFTFK